MAELGVFKRKILRLNPRTPGQGCRLRKEENADCDELARKGRAKWLVEAIEKRMTRAHARALEETTECIEKHYVQKIE